MTGYFVLMAYPLEQGLKRLPWRTYAASVRCLNGLSTRTRIETRSPVCGWLISKRVLMAYPLEQGLKQ